MDDLIEKITTQFNIPADKAKGIIGTVVGFMKDKLPGPVASQLDRFVPDGEGDAGGSDDGEGGGLMDQAKGMLGGFGKG